MALTVQPESVYARTVDIRFARNVAAKVRPHARKGERGRVRGGEGGRGPGPSLALAPALAPALSSVRMQRPPLLRDRLHPVDQHDAQRPEERREERERRDRGPLVLPRS